MDSRTLGFHGVLIGATMALLLAGCDTPAQPTTSAFTSDGGVAAAPVTTTALSQEDYCYLPSHGRGAGTVPTECPAGTQKDGGLCYPLCQSGYTGVGPVCWQSCPSGYRDDGAFCRKDAVIFSKASYGRGAGSAPSACAPGDQKDGSLCYPACQSGYYGVGPVCWQSCRSGYTDNGATCYRHLFDWYWKGSYGRGGGYTPNRCPSGQQMDGGLCYPSCAGGYYGVGPVCWQSCPSGYVDDGATCRKDAVVIAKASYGRGAGSPLVCSSNLQYDAGLCYTPCESGFRGVGPVCWGQCPGGMVACGAGCASSDGACANATISQVTASLDVAMNLASAVMSFGGSTAVRATARLALSAAGRAELKQKIKEQLEEQALETMTEEMLETTAEAMTHAAEVGTIDATALDPTGIAALVEAFDYPVCNASN